MCAKLFVKNVRVCSHRSQIEGITFYLWQSLKSYLPYLKFARGFQAASAQAQFYTQRSRIHLSALWRRWTCSTNKTKTSPVLCSSAASKHTQRTHVHVYVRGSYWLLFISIPVPLRSFVEASQNPPAKLYLKPKGVYAWNFFYEENLCSYWPIDAWRKSPSTNP